MSNDDLILGIDLGTTFSAMSIVNKFGKAEITMNAEGKPTTPSVVYYYDEDGVVVGEEAVKMVVVEPENVVRFIKRNMGEPDFDLEFFGRVYTPQEISALILRKLKEDAEELVGQEIRDAVITVPAYFNSAQRGATAEAGAIAGFNVLSIINEPTAAAIAYGIDKSGDPKRILVFDLGGGTFDVTVMEIDGAELTTLASDGNAELGGKDWDDRLVNHVADEFLDKFDDDPRDDAIPYQELYERCLAAKIALSTKDRAMIPVSYAGKRHGVKVTRVLFEELTADLVAQCEDTTQLVLDKAGLGWDDIDDVILVGGSTRMPMIRDLLTRMSGKEPNTDVNPDECVCQGAALAGIVRHRPDHPSLTGEAFKKKRRRTRREPRAPAPQRTPGAAAIGLADGGHRALNEALASPTDTMDEPPDRFTIRDATTHPLGLVVLDRQRRERVVELIPEGTPLPYEFRGRFAYAYDNMRAVRVEVTEGHGTSREEVAVIGSLELTDLPPRPKGTPIEVIYQYGVNQILEVHVIDVESGLSRSADIRFAGGLSRSEIEAARDRNRRIAVD